MERRQDLEAYERTSRTDESLKVKDRMGGNKGFFNESTREGFFEGRRLASGRWVLSVDQGEGFFQKRQA